MWNTGLNKLRNATSGSIYFVDQEDTDFNFTLNSGGLMSFGPVFPWCDNSLEVSRKAFRVHRGTDATGPILFYMFQYFRDDIVYFIPGGQAVWSARQNAGEGLSGYLDVVIGVNELPTATASEPDVVIGTTFLKIDHSSSTSE